MSSDKWKFGDTVEGIYSIKTKENYRQVLNEFTHFCTEKKGESPRADLQKLIKKYGMEYLEMRDENGYSKSTISRDRSALNKVACDHKIEYKVERSIHQISRSRNNNNKTNNHFNEKINSDLVSFAKGTGGRRSDLANLRKEDFKIIDDRLYVNFKKSKGGKDRISPVLDKYAETIINRLDLTAPGERVFSRIHKHADIHSYRRDYAQELYKSVINDKDLKSTLINKYPLRNESVKSKYYTTRGQDNVFHGKRSDIYIITQALGHNRLDVAVNHYLR